MAGSPNPGRERTYLADEEERLRKKKAFTSESPRIGALASMRPSQIGATTPGQAPEAPTSVGQLATPSTMGREAPPSNPEEFNERVARNESFLSNPETRAALIQFGVSMMATAGRGNIGSNIGQSLGRGLQAAGRVRLGKEAATKEAREAEMEEKKFGLEERKFGLDEEKMDLERLKVGLEVGEIQRDLAKQERRRKLFGAVAGDPKDMASMNSMPDLVLLDLAGELVASGDDDGAKMAIDLANARRLGTTTNDVIEWRTAVLDGSFDGGFGEWTLRPKPPTMKIEQITHEAPELNSDLMKAAIEEQKVADDLMGQAQELRVAKGLAERTPTGYTVPWTLPIRAALLDAGFVWNEEDEANITMQQVLESQTNQLALRMRNPDSGFGLTGNTSDRDVQFLKDTVGNLGRTPEANVAAIMILEAKQRRKSEIAQAKADYIFENNSLKGWGKEREILFTGDDAPSIFTEEEKTFLDSFSNPLRKPMIGGVEPSENTPPIVEDIEAPASPPDYLPQEDKDLWYDYTDEEKKTILRGVQKPE